MYSPVWPRLTSVKSTVIRCGRSSDFVLRRELQRRVTGRVNRRVAALCERPVDARHIELEVLVGVNLKFSLVNEGGVAVLKLYRSAFWARRTGGTRGHRSCPLSSIPQSLCLPPRLALPDTGHGDDTRFEITDIAWLVSHLRRECSCFAAAPGTASEADWTRCCEAAGGFR